MTDWNAVQAWAATASSLIAFGGLLFFAGRVTEQSQNTRTRVEEVRTEAAKRLDGHDEKFDEHDAQFAEHGASIARLEAWRDGYNAALAARGNYAVPPPNREETS